MLHVLRHWQPYLIGKEFTLRTDHSPNISLAKGKVKSFDTLTDKILQFMPFKMEFLNGNKMFVDALSRPPSSPIIAAILKSPNSSQRAQPDVFAPSPLLDSAIIKAHQLRDSNTSQIMLQLNNLLPASKKISTGLTLYYALSIK